MASMTITNARAVVDGTIRRCNLKLVDGKIKGIMPPCDTYGKTYDARERLVLPGFIDLHTHGCNGIDFNSTDYTGLRTARDYYAAHGVTAFLPTVRADSEETMLRSILSIVKAKSNMPCPQILGINMEGPFIAPAWRGNMDADSLQPCSYSLFKRLQDASGGNIKLITVSPELDGAAELVRKLAIEGVRVSLGHSGAEYERAAECVEAGAISFTHVFNSMGAIEALNPSVACAMLESDCFCEVVCDPSLIHPAMLRLLLKVKGLTRIVAVTDSIMTCGMAEGLYRMGGADVVVRDGSASTLYGQTSAGSMLTADRMLRNILEATELPLPKAVAMMTESPARLLGIYHAKGSLSVGKDADFTVMDDEYNVIATFSEGEMIYSR